jgi:hypothetical protein
MPFGYKIKTKEQLRNLFNAKKRAELIGFDDFDDFYNWYNEQPKICTYCQMNEIELQEIVITSRLSSKRFPSNGEIGQGKNRGIWLEIDRMNPIGLYSRENCVLACYFCNNDKSDVFSYDQYREFFQNRAQFLRGLIERN